jgi:3-oxoacyl-[acyl-carrier protein] reductase
MTASANQITQATQTAIVTGASRGIGAAIAQRLAKEGYAVVVNYAGKADEAQAVVQSITSAGGKAVAVQADVSSSAAVKALFDETIKAFGRVDVLINNAGIMPPTLPQLADTDDDTFDRLFAVNVKGTFNTLREAGARLQHGGRIVNFSTSVIGLALPGYAVYGATKSAVETFTNIMAKELRGKNIRVNAIAPGPTATALFLDGKTPETIERMSKMAPLERLGTPEDIASAVAFLVSEDAGWVNGQTLRANGGVV